MTNVQQRSPSDIQWWRVVLYMERAKKAADPLPWIIKAVRLEAKLKGVRT